MLLEPQDQHVRISRTDSIAAIAAEAALFLSHESGRRHALVGEIATIANGILKGRGEDSLTLDPQFRLPVNRRELIVREKRCKSDKPALGRQSTRLSGSRVLTFGSGR